MTGKPAQVPAVWSDHTGQYDDFDQYLSSNPQYSFSDVDADLSSERSEA